MNLNIDEVTREADRNASLLRRAVIDAGRAIMAFYSRNFAVGFKDDRSPLTEADMASHHVILRRLSELPVPLGYLPVLSEEGGLSDISQRSEWTAWWLIDPLDGTKEFVKRNGEFTVNIAMIVRRRPGGPGEPLAGWVYAPVPDILYEGIPGRPALKWDKAEEGAAGVHSLPVEEPHTPPRIVVSRSHLTPETETAIQAMSRYFGSGDPVNCGSSLKLCRIAEGMAEFYPRPAPTMEWDTAAADAVCRASGARVVQALNGRDMEYGKENLLNPWFLAARDPQIIDLGVRVFSKS